MGTSTLMALGTRAMTASYAQLQTTGNNIANANTPGYSRQQAQLVTAGGQYTGAGFFGRGVDVSTVTRSYDRFLTNQATASASLSAADQARLGQLTQLEKAFALGESGIGHAAGQLLNAFVDVANNPQDASSRHVALARARELSSRFQAAGDQLAALQTGATQDVRAGVEAVNALAQQVAVINRQISAANGTGHAPNDLLDRRDQLVAQISEKINVTSVSAADGSVGLFIGGGQSLVLGSTANTLKAMPDVYDPAKLQLAMREGGTDRIVPQDALSGGSLAGMLRFQNEDLTSARNLLGQLAVAISAAVNEQQSLGLDLGTPSRAGSPIFAVGSPRVLPASSNSGNASLGLTVADGALVQASDYELRFDGSRYALTRLSDGEAMPGSPYTPSQLAAGVTFDGVTLQLGASGALAGDRFLLQPVSDAALNMKTVLSDPSAIAAASPVTATAAVGNTGTASVASARVVDSGAFVPGLTANITFDDTLAAPDNYRFELRDAANTVVGSSTGEWTAGQPIRLNGFELMLDGVPSHDDTVSVVPTTAVAGNNGNALAFVDLAGVGFVGAQMQGGTLVPGRSVTDAYASAVAEIGVRVQSADTAAGISAAAASNAETARANKSGVNLDEEAAKLIQYQQSYQAAAKMLQVAQSVFDTLLQQMG